MVESKWDVSTNGFQLQNKFSNSAQQQHSTKQHSDCMEITWKTMWNSLDSIQQLFSGFQMDSTHQFHSKGQLSDFERCLLSVQIGIGSSECEWHWVHNLSIKWMSFHGIPVILCAWESEMFVRECTFRWVQPWKELSNLRLLCWISIHTLLNIIDKFLCVETCLGCVYWKGAKHHLSRVLIRWKTHTHSFRLQYLKYWVVSICIKDYLNVSSEWSVVEFSCLLRKNNENQHTCLSNTKQSWTHQNTLRDYWKHAN